MGRDLLTFFACLPQAVDCNVGVVTSWIFPGHVNEAVFNLFLQFFVFPALQQQTGARQRYIMYDNLAAHTCERTQAAGHVPMHRPVHSPDFGPVEFCFSNLLMFLQRHERLLTPTNLFAFVSFWAGGRLTAAKVRGYFAKAGYAIPGRRYRPYL